MHETTDYSSTGAAHRAASSGLRALRCAIAGSIACVGGIGPAAAAPAPAAAYLQAARAPDRLQTDCAFPRRTYEYDQLPVRYPTSSGAPPTDRPCIRMSAFRAADWDGQSHTGERATQTADGWTIQFSSLGTLGTSVLIRVSKDGWSDARSTRPDPGLPRLLGAPSADLYSYVAPPGYIILAGHDGDHVFDTVAGRFCRNALGPPKSNETRVFSIHQDGTVVFADEPYRASSGAITQKRAFDRAKVCP